MNPRQFIATLIGLVFLTGPLLSNAETAEQYQRALKGWEALLREQVDDQGRIDFYSIQQQPELLENMVRVIGVYGPQSTPEDFQKRSEILAYHANAYNALAMYGVIVRDIPEGFTSLLKRLSFFRLRKVQIDGQRTSLHHYENRVIRPLGEARLHFALNCMVRDCPRLPQQPYWPEQIEQQLQAATIEFLRNEKHLRVDHQKQRVYLSAILDFYTEDFVASGRKEDLATYINPFLPEPLPAEYQIEFMDYDWRINRQPGHLGAGQSPNL